MESTTNPIIIQGVLLADWLAIGILLTTIIGIFSLFVVSKLERRADRIHKKENACNSIINEIDLIEDGLTGSQYELVHHDDISFTKALFSCYAFDSVVNSGEYLEFKASVQIELSTFYLSLKLRNEALRQFNQYYDRFFIDGFTTEKINRWNKDEKIRYEIPITIYEKYITENLVKVRTSVRDQLPIGFGSSLLSKIRKWCLLKR